MEKTRAKKRSSLRMQLLYANVREQVLTAEVYRLKRDVAYAESRLSGTQQTLEAERGRANALSEAVSMLARAIGERSATLLAAFVRQAEKSNGT